VSKCVCNSRRTASSPSLHLHASRYTKKGPVDSEAQLAILDGLPSYGSAMAVTRLQGPLRDGAIRLRVSPCSGLTAAGDQGFPKYSFVGGHNDAALVPVDALMTAASAVLKREGTPLWARERTTWLSTAPQLSCQQTAIVCQHHLRTRRHPHHLWLAAGNWSCQRPAACRR
jgi:hypothetical protein